MDDKIYFFGSCAYGVRIDFPPTWGRSLHMVEGDERALVPGMTFHLPIAFSVPGKFAVALSETVSITTDGCKMLVKHPKRLFRAWFQDAAFPGCVEIQ